MALKELVPKLTIKEFLSLKINDYEKGLLFIVISIYNAQSISSISNF